MGWSCVAVGMRAGCVLVMMSTALSAAEIAATSKVDAVTVYPSGAEVVRTAKVRIEPGEHVVILSDLPAQAVGASLRVEGKASGPLEIGAVDHRRLFVTRDADAETARRQLELEAEKLRDERARLAADADAAEIQKTFVQNLAGLPTLAPTPGATPGPQPDWNALYAMIGTRHAEAQQRALETRTKIRELDRRIEDVTKKIAATAPRRLEQTEVKITVVAAGRVDADLLVRYQVTDAGWQPLYEARLEPGARNVTPKLRLIRRATIRQRTGEPWNDVALTLSTARPTAGTAAPELRPVTVADDLIRIRHTVSDEKRAEGGLISTTRSDERMFKITVRNMHERPISYSILDQIPVSQNQEIRVDLLGPYGAVASRRG